MKQSSLIVGFQQIKQTLEQNGQATVFPKWRILTEYHKVQKDELVQNGTYPVQM
jgi:hypothetical protein